jgi:chorismate dehydratase
VSYLNAKPLIDGLDLGVAEVVLDVPSALLGRLLDGEVDVALCPVIDYFSEAAESAGLRLVPVGGIGCDGPTHTVKLFAKVPLERVRSVVLDTDSHTSVALLKVLMGEVGREEVRYERAGGAKPRAAFDAVLLIGDKVVTDAPDAGAYPHVVDLGAAWREMTGLPFVFATWLARANVALGDLPGALRRLRVRNHGKRADIALRYAAGHGWPVGAATDYLTHVLRYDVDGRAMEAIGRFGRLAVDSGAASRWRDLVVHPDATLASTAGV